MLSTLMMNFLHTESFKRAVNVARFLRLCRVPGPALHLAQAHDLIRFQDHGHVPHHTRPVALLDHQLLKDGTSHALLLLCLRANTPPQHLPRRRSFVPRDAFVFKIQRELGHPKRARKDSRLSRNGSQFCGVVQSVSSLILLLCFLFRCLSMRLARSVPDTMDGYTDYNIFRDVILACEHHFNVKFGDINASSLSRFQVYEFKKWLNKRNFDVISETKLDAFTDVPFNIDGFRFVRR